MGQDCCYSSKDAHSDLRQGRPKKKTAGMLEQNTFKRSLEEPEFVVTRRDSLGMAAKEHTQQMLAETAGGDSEGTNDVHRSMQSEGKLPDRDSLPQERRIETENTLGVAAAVNIASARQSIDNQNCDIPLSQSLGNMSFGMQNRLTLGRSPENKADFDEGDKDHLKVKDELMTREMATGSLISIKDIQEVRDKTPASPATAQQDIKETYFQ